MKKPENKPIYRIGLIITLSVFSIVLFQKDLNYKPLKNNVEIEHYDFNKVQNGDIIFRRGIGLVSEIVLASDNSCPFSHVGLIKKSKSEILVIHAAPSDIYKKSNLVEEEPIDVFLNKNSATDFTLMRVKCNDNVNIAVEFADSIYQSQKEFDDNFDLINSDKFYCTELVYKSFLKAGLDLSGGNLDTLLIPIGKNPFLLPRTILKSALLKKVNITKTKEE